MRILDLGQIHDGILFMVLEFLDLGSDDRRPAVLVDLDPRRPHREPLIQGGWALQKRSPHSLSEQVV
jgi:hypothetical protein